MGIPISLSGTSTGRSARESTARANIAPYEEQAYIIHARPLPRAKLMESHVFWKRNIFDGGFKSLA